MAAIRILMAEDNDRVALTLEEQLKGLGYDVTSPYTDFVRTIKFLCPRGAEGP